MNHEMVPRKDVDAEVARARRAVRDDFMGDPDLPYRAWAFDGSVLVAVNGERWGDPVEMPGGRRPRRDEVLELLRVALAEAPAGATVEVEVVWQECARVRESANLQEARHDQYEPFDWVEVTLAKASS